MLLGRTLGRIPARRLGGGSPHAVGAIAQQRTQLGNATYFGPKRESNSSQTDAVDLELSCDDALCEKPDARYFAYARGRIEGAWGWRQPDTLHVAQSQYHDIGVSKRLGIATCWIERRHAQKGSGGTLESEHAVPDYHFHTLAQLADAVDAGR